VVDDKDVIGAALRCPFCLHEACRVLLHPYHDAAAALCACERCELQWSTVLDPAQAQRLLDG
jgi:hypothetical protein